MSDQQNAGPTESPVGQQKINPGRLLFIGLMILLLCSGLGFLAGVLAGDGVGLWSFVGLGVGIVIAVFMLRIVVFRNIEEGLAGH